jgi:hypothetical protein
VRIECGPELKNETTIPFYDVHVSDLVLDADTSFHFDKIETLGPSQVLPIAPANALTKAISNSIVKRMLSGEPPATAWPLQITWRWDEEQTMAAWWEIRVLSLPLEIGCAPADSRGGATAGPSTALR